MKKLNVLLTALLALSFLPGCSSTPPVKTQEYAKLKNSRTFEYDFPAVWKAIEAVVKDYPISDRDPSKVDALEMKKLTKRTLETDWIFSQSRDKYQEYTINDTPRKKYLQTKIKFEIIARAVMGGTDVQVNTEEEIERLDSDGTSAGYDRVKEVDSSRADEILNKINNAILSAAP